MSKVRLRWLFYLAGLAILAGGVIGFALAIAYTAYAFTDPHAPYGVYVPVLGFGSLGAAVLGGGALLLLANLERRVERLEAAAVARSFGN